MKKRFFAILMAAALVLAMSLPALAAAGPADLTITGSFADNKTATAVKIFSDTSDSLSDDPFYVLEDAWKGFFDGKISGASANDADISTKAYRYMVAMQSDSDDMNALAENMRVYYLAHKNDHANDATKPAFSTETTTTSNGSAVFSNLAAGSYLVLPPTGSTSVTRSTDAMIQNVRGNIQTVAMKSTYPTVEKKVQPAGDNGTPTDDTHVKIGDYVKFTLTSTVPEMSQYTTYYFAFKDTLSTGLTLVKPSDTNYNTYPMTFTIGSKTLTKKDNAEDTAHDYLFTQNNQNFAVSVPNLKAFADSNNLRAGDTVTFTYYARLNENAVVSPATDGATNTNSATVEYSNDPSDVNSKEESSPDISKVYTYGIELFKYSEETTNTKTPLSGAKFSLYSDPSSNDDRTAISLVDVTTSGAEEKMYRVATSEDAGTVTEIETPASGIVHINGLDLGPYYLKETAAPTGYNDLASDVAVIISKDNSTTENVTENNLASVYYTVDNTQNSNANDNVVNIQNRPGSTLPTTGDIGTIGLTIAGVAIVIFGVLATSRRKKARV